MPVRDERRTVYRCELAWLGGDRAERDVVIETDGDRIAAVAVGGVAPPEAVSLPGLTLPGLANAHSHSFQRALRARTQTGTGSFWTWREEMYRLAAVLDPDLVHRLARATFAEMALAGVTCVGEFHYLHHGPGGRPYDDPHAMTEAVVAAAGDAGVRLTLLDACYLRGGLSPDGSPLPLTDEQRRFADRDVDAWIARVDDAAARFDRRPDVRHGAAVHSVRAVDRPAIAAVADWARTGNRPLHAHVSEQPAENEACRAAHGLSPTALLEAAGALDSRFTAVHATHVTDDDAALLARSRSTVCLCPTTEGDLADGIAPTDRFAALGVALSLGSDSQATVDLFEEARCVERHERLARQVRGTHRVADLLAALTTRGHDSLGWPDGGRLTVGAAADLVTVDLTSVRTAGCGGDPEVALAAAVYAATASDVRHVVAGGRVVVSDGTHRSLDVARELSNAVAAVREAGR